MGERGRVVVGRVGERGRVVGVMDQAAAPGTPSGGRTTRKCSGTRERGSVTIRPRDGARTRLFVAPAGQWITLEAGRIAAARYTPATGAIVLTLDPADAHTPRARLFVTRTVARGRNYIPTSGTADRGGIALPLGAGTTEVTLRPAG